MELFALFSWNGVLFATVSENCEINDIWLNLLTEQSKILLASPDHTLQNIEEAKHILLCEEQNNSFAQSVIK